MKKIVKEHISSLIIENKITKSYDRPMDFDSIKALVQKIRRTYKRDQIVIIPNMAAWLSINNFDKYSQNRWIRAAIDTMFKYSGGSWMPINQRLTDDEIVEKVMGFWTNKLTK